MSNFELVGLGALAVALGKIVSDFTMAWIVAWRMTHQRNKALGKLAEIEESMRGSNPQELMKQLFEDMPEDEEVEEELET